MKKTINKWDKITPLQQKVGDILKISAAIVFLSIWTPAFIWFLIEVSKLIFK
tara:strand:- start:40 stop:195 length:156 start_codon:yes stop_codon:yes gene_type:complete